MTARQRIGALAAAFLVTSLPAPPAAADPDPPNTGPAPRRCPLVDRGSPTDGITTITVVQAPAPCTAGGIWTGWECAVVQSDANDNGASYQMDVRWNRVGQPVIGSATWMIGQQSTGFLRAITTFAAQTQDNLDAAQVRSIEISVLGAGTNTMPRNGYPNISSIYADLLEWLVTQGIATGVVAHYGNSGGSLMGASSLAYHGTDQLLDGIVFGGGPFWADMEPMCTDPASPFYGDPVTRSRADVINWTDINGTAPCAPGVTDEDPWFDCRSILGSQAQTVYPGLRVAIIVGQQDINNPWITNSAMEYFNRITVESKSFDQPATTPHQVMNDLSGANLVEQRMLEIMAAGAGRRSGTAAAAGTPGPHLEAGAPNPFRGSTIVPFVLPRSAPMTLSVHDVAGRRIATLIHGDRPAGRQSAIWNGRTARGTPAPAGVYFVRLAVPGAQRVTKIQLLR